MKTKFSTLLIGTVLMAVFVVSCGDPKENGTRKEYDPTNLKEVRTEKKRVQVEINKLKAELKVLVDLEENMDTTISKTLVTVLEIKEEPMDHKFEFQGDVETKKNLILYPESSGKISAIYVKRGQKVSKGQTLAKIDDNGLTERLDQTKVAENLAKTVYLRQKRLWEQEIGSQITFLQAEADFKAKTKMVAELKTLIDKTKVIAPFSGTIDNVMKEVGELVSSSAGNEMFRIINLENMYMTANIPERFLPNIQKGKKVEMFFPILGERQVSNIREVSSFIDPTNRTFEIEIGINNDTKKIKPNLTGKLFVSDYYNESAILVPQSIVSESASGDQFLYTIVKDKYGKYICKKTPIKTGYDMDDKIEVVEGLKVGDIVVEEGARLVRDQLRVSIK